MTQSWGRFILPNVIELEYQTNKSDRLLIKGFLMPVREHETKIFLFSSGKSRLPLGLIKGIMKYGFKVALKQDEDILNRLGAHRLVTGANHKHVSTYLDLVGPYVQQLLEGKQLEKKKKEVTKR